MDEPCRVGVEQTAQLDSHASRLGNIEQTLYSKDGLKEGFIELRTEFHQVAGFIKGIGLWVAGVSSGILISLVIIALKVLFKVGG